MNDRSESVQREPGSRRSYRSTLRDERAADTRKRVVEAARALFAERGFAGATMAMIAKRAGVATPTVYAAFPSKADIVRELVDRLESDVDGEDWRRRIAEEPDPLRKLDLYAAWHGVLFSSGKDVLRAASNAGDDPAVVDLRTQGDTNALIWLAPIIESLSAAGLLAPGLDTKQALDRAVLLSSVELYFRATIGRGWSDDEYQAWLAETLRQQLTRA